MNELIKIEQREGRQTVNARDLWEGLESKRQFGNWIQDRLEGFTQEQDFTVNKFVNGKSTQIDYYLTIDTAKHIAMLERNDKGRAIRQYFIEVENRARENVTKVTATKLPAGAQIKAMESLYGPVEARKRIDFVLGYKADPPQTTLPATRLSKAAFAVEMKEQQKASDKAWREAHERMLF